jgi:hypothetical protein
VGLVIPFIQPYERRPVRIPQFNKFRGIDKLELIFVVIEGLREAA